MIQRVEYAYEQRDATILELSNAGKVIVEDIMINLGMDGVPQTCFFIVVDAPPVSQGDLIAQLDQRVLELEYELIMKEGS